jgi:hypothetical protein
VSLREAGEICLLAAVCAPHRHLLIPRFDTELDLVLLEDVASIVLRYHGFEPRHYDNADIAKARFASDTANGAYPVVLTKLDTTGEKPYEEFVGAGEEVREIGMDRILAVRYQATTPRAITRFISQVEAALTDIAAPIDKQDLIAWISEVIPQFRHVETGQTLDDRM